MKAILLFLFFLSSPAVAQDACSTSPSIQCPDGINACTKAEQCIDADGCTHNRIIYQQDCTPSPRPNYCPPGNATKPVLVLRDRKTCPPSLGK
jgi:hypothetical protein